MVTEFNVNPKIVSVKRYDEPKILDEFRKECIEEWKRIQGNVPDKLFHYTSAEGFLGIINSRSLWFTHIEYFEDKSEAEYARNLMLNLLEDFEEITKSEKEKIFLNNLKYYFAEAWQYYNEDIYVACFCSEMDVLSQWERFGNKGYSLGFSFKKETYFGYKTGDKYHAIPTEINKVIYEKEKQINLIKPLLEKLFTLLRENNDVRVMDCETIFQNVINPWLLNFKNSFFKDENEWRFTVNLQGLSREKNKDIYSHLSFRTNDGIIIPYVSLIMMNRDFDHPTKFPLTDLFLGPTLKDYELKSIEYLLRKEELPEATIKKSIIPIR